METTITTDNTEKITVIVVKLIILNKKLEIKVVDVVELIELREFKHKILDFSLIIWNFFF